MKTEILTEAQLETAAAALRAGELVAFPTETVYGLGGDALKPDVSARIYAAKGRPSDNPLIVHIARREQLEPLVEGVSEAAERLMKTFWPGPLTLIFKKSALVPAATSGGLNTVAVRMPAHPLALKLLEACRVPVAAPSANLSGKPSPTEAAHVYRDLQGVIPYVLDGGSVGIGVESTIVDLSGAKPVLLRPGAVTLSQLEAELGMPVEVDPAVLGQALAPGQAPKAPGMKYRHYAPEAPLLLLTPQAGAGTQSGNSAEMPLPLGKLDETERAVWDSRIAAVAAAELERARGEGMQRFGILCSEELYPAMAELNQRYAAEILILGSRRDALSMTRRLFACLRRFDELGVELILAESYDDTELGFALMNRLRKAAGGHRLWVH